VVNVFILGKGFVGTHIYNSFSKENNFHLNIASLKDVNYFDEIALKRYIRESHHDNVNDIVIINCSGYTGRPNVDACESNKEICLDYNTKLPVFLSNFCDKYNYWLVNISSGCIFTGYEKDFTELDIPNFGMFNPISSFYSKTKHLAEALINNNAASTFRIRMPFCAYNSERNYINKIINYDNLVCYKNSMTSIDDLCTFTIEFLLYRFYKNSPGIYNVVNEGALDGKDVVELLSKYNIINTNWRFVDIESLSLKANRSNCVLSTDKIKSLGLALPDSRTSMESCIKQLSV